MMSGKYDPPDKVQLLATFRRTPSIPELISGSNGTRFTPKVKADGDASHANPMENESLETHAVGCQSSKRGRKPVVTPERGALISAGVGGTSWNAAKRVDAALRERIASARDD